MSTIQQASSIGVSNLSVVQETVVQKTTAQGTLPITGVKSSTIKNLAISGISDQQGESTRTVNTETFLSKIGIKTTQQTTTMGGDSTATTPSSMSESVTANAEMTTSNKSVALGDYINLPTEQGQSDKGTKADHDVKQITNCLNDYYTQNNNETTTHRLENICEQNPISGYIEPKCNVNQPRKNQINAYELNEKGDTYTAETKNSAECQQPILTRPAPKKIRRCLYVSTVSDDELNAYNRTVVNACNRPVKGHLDKGCLVVGKLAGSWERFTLRKQGDSRSFVTEKTYGWTCASPIHEGDAPKPPTPVAPAPKPPTPVAPAPKPIPKPAPKPALKPNQTAVFCQPEDLSAPDTPEAERIIAGEKLQSREARYLVFVNNKGVGGCTGTLISDRHVLTAAHCLTQNSTSVDTSPLEQITVKHDPYPSRGVQYIPSRAYKVVAGTIHPDYDALYATTNSDVAVLELEEPAVNGQIIPLSTDEHFCEFAQSVDAAKLVENNKNASVWQDGNAIIQGFGLQKDNNGDLVRSSIAQHGKVVVTDIGDNEGMIISYPNVYGTDICNGDSGGPLLFETKSREKVQVGVTVGTEINDHCCSQNRYTSCYAKSFYANMRNREMRKWIEDRKAEDSKTVQPKDRTRLRFSPSTCVEKSDVADGFLSWLGIQKRRRMTFTNNCHHKNHPAKVDIKFYSLHGKIEKQEAVSGIEKTEHVVQVDVGETKTVHTSNRTVKAVLTWSDLGK